MPKHHSCILCGSERLTPMESFRHKHALLQCRDCGLVFMEDIPTAEVLDRHYSTYAYGSGGYLSPLTVASYNKLLDHFEKFRKHNRILDAGCGRGWFLDEAAKRGWEVFGSEYSPKAVELCRSRGIKMHAGSLVEEAFDTGAFDVITSFEVLEHMNTPNREMQLFHRFLRKGGLLYVTTPNFNSVMRYYLGAEYDVIGYPEHLTYFTRSTLKKLAKQNGFSVRRLSTTGLSVSRWQKSLNKPTERLGSQQSADEQLRSRLASRFYLRWAKSLANRALTITGTGLTLKAWFVKSS